MPNRDEEEAGTSAYASWAYKPHSVGKWDNFIQNANRMAVDDTRPIVKPIFGNAQVSNERMVEDALLNNVLMPLSLNTGGRNPSEWVFQRSDILDIIKGNPDIVLVAGGGLVLPIEVKAAWNIPGDNIVEILNAEDPPVSVSNSIMQIFGYMAHNRCRYGVLSTYENTWFFMRPVNDTGALFISDVVKYEDTSPTLLRCFAYLRSLARQGSDCSFPPTFPPQLPGDEQLNRGDLRLEKFDWDSFELTGVLGKGRSGKTFDGTLRGERVAIKLADLWQKKKLHEEMITEARVYVQLGKLQGHGIPKLMGVGYTAGGLFALMTEFAGSQLEPWNINDEMREMIVGVLARIHDAGLLHGDIRRQNILVDHKHDGPRITFIDFGFSKPFSNQEESEREMAVLRAMIGFRPMKKPRIHHLGG
jgi:predicted Ser/Thr protein kinase